MCLAATQLTSVGTRSISDGELLTVNETAQHIKVNAQTVRNWIDRGELPALRVGGRRVRIQRSALEAFIGLQPDSADLHAPADVSAGALSGRQLEDAAGLLEQIAADLTKLAAILRGDGQ